MAVEADLTRRALAAFYDDWRALAAASSEGEIVEGEGVVLIATGIPTPIFNKVFVFDTPADGWLDDARTFFEKRALQFSVELRPGIDDAETLAAGFQRFGDMPFMIWDEPAQAWPDVDGIVIVELSGPDDGFNAAVAEGFGMPVSLVESISEVVRDASELHQFVARDGDRAVGTSMRMDGAGAGIYTVATVSEYRGRGIGAALTARAARGAPFAYLQASSLGLPVYERMGFRVVERAGLYALPAMS